MKKYKYILFDLDGMMVNTDAGVFNCVCYAHEKLGYPVPDTETLKKYMGPPLKYSFVNFSGMTAEESEQALAFYRERYSVTGLYEGHVFDGIPELLKALKESGVLLGTATSKPEEYAKKILEHFDIAKYFDKITGATFGDSRAHKVGIACFGVYMDCAEEGEHEQAGADYVAHGVKELTEALLVHPADA